MSLILGDICIDLFRFKVLSCLQLILQGFRGEEHTIYHVLMGVERLSAHKYDKMLYMSPSEGVMVIHVGLLNLSSKLNIVQKKTVKK